MPRDKHQRVPLVPNVVAGGDGIGAGIAQVLEYRLGDAKAARGVLAVDDREVRRKALPQLREPLAHHVPAGPPQHIA